jgi:hypothetical protein
MYGHKVGAMKYTTGINSRDLNARGIAEHKARKGSCRPGGMIPRDAVAAELLGGIACEDRARGVRLGRPGHDALAPARD